MEFQDTMEWWVELLNRVITVNVKAAFSLCILGHFVTIYPWKGLHGKIHMLDITSNIWIPNIRISGTQTYIGRATSEYSGRVPICIS